jgi:hypothetical protein
MKCIVTSALDLVFDEIDTAVEEPPNCEVPRQVEQ